MNTLNKGRYTIDGSVALETRLESFGQQVVSLIQSHIPKSKLAGILLGGGYGRGEGGVLKTSAGDMPYNDLEYYVFLKSGGFLLRRRFQSMLEPLARHLSDTFGIDVEFKVMTLSQFYCAPTSLFYYDLFWGHKHVFGPSNLLVAGRHHATSARIPLSEGARLLMNRCSGLLFAMERLACPNFSVSDSDFVFRNIRKAELCLGDVFLIQHRGYHWSCLERQKRLNAFSCSEPWFCDLVDHFNKGIDFKLSPIEPNYSVVVLTEMLKVVSSLCLVIWLWSENRRLASDLPPFIDPIDYALSIVDKCPDTFALRNVVVNAVAFRCCPPYLDYLWYPRGRLFATLPILLWASDLYGSDRINKHICSQLRCNGNTKSDFVSAYYALWHCFS